MERRITIGNPQSYSISTKTTPRERERVHYDFRDHGERPEFTAKDLKVGDRMMLLFLDKSDGMLLDYECVVLQKTYDKSRDRYMVISGLRGYGSGLQVLYHDRRWFAPDERISRSYPLNSHPLATGTTDPRDE